jgi:5-formyltetrahydrofolate cyclo-ligase
VLSKNSLRNEYKKRRRGIARPDYEAASAAIASRLLSLPETRSARLVLSYVAHGREADTRGALAALVAEGKIVITPAGRDPARALTCFHFLTHDDPLLDEAWAPGYEPTAVCDAVILGEVDLFVVPGIVWDTDGYRIGYGGGYFDRLLAEASPGAALVGLAYDWQIVDRVPRDSWDVPVNCIITESRILRIG